MTTADSGTGFPRRCMTVWNTVDAPPHPEDENVRRNREFSTRPHARLISTGRRARTSPRRVRRRFRSPPPSPSPQPPSDSGAIDQRRDRVRRRPCISPRRRRRSGIVTYVSAIGGLRHHHARDRISPTSPPAPQPQAAITSWLWPRPSAERHRARARFRRGGGSIVGPRSRPC